MNTASSSNWLSASRRSAGRPKRRRLLEELFARKEKNAAAAREKLQAFNQQHQEKTPEEPSE